MLDLRGARDDREAFERALTRRGDPDLIQLLDQALAADVRRREVISEVEVLKAERNRVSRDIGEAKRRGEDAADAIARMSEVGETIKGLDAQQAAAEEQIEQLLLRIPNLPHARVPPGEEGEGEVLSEWGEPRDSNGGVPHWDLAATHGLRALGTGPAYPGGDVPVFDLERAAKISGSGFPLLIGAGARLSRALIQFMLDVHTRRHGYLEVAPPFLVTRDSMTATGQLPKFEEDMYRTEPDDLFPIPTAEVPVTNLHRGEILEADDLPLAYVAYTPCFRREAGAAGRDTRGLLRVHQFDKVELVRFTTPERSDEELEELTRHAETILEELELPYRRVLLPGGDLGFANAITYDLEVWAPGVEAWLEVSSCSSYTDYQARRAGIRYRPESGGSPRFVHTLNGSGLALARVLVALLEHGYEEGAGIRLPDALHPYLGFERLEPLD